MVIRGKSWRKRLTTTKYHRAATFPVEEILPKVFTVEQRRELRNRGVSPHSQEWRELETRKFEIEDPSGEKRIVTADMRSERLQTFVRNLSCKRCEIKGSFFALERDIAQPQAKGDKYHLNMYGLLEDGTEVLMTKDHIKARANGGENRLANYQTLCVACNSIKADKKYLPS